jgi:hypothetical protein
LLHQKRRGRSVKKRGLWSIFFTFLSGFAALQLVFSDDSNDGKFFYRKSKGISNAMYGVSIIVFMFF